MAPGLAYTVGLCVTYAPLNLKIRLSTYIRNMLSISMTNYFAFFRKLLCSFHAEGRRNCQFQWSTFFPVSNEKWHAIPRGRNRRHPTVRRYSICGMSGNSLILEGNAFVEKTELFGIRTIVMAYGIHIFHWSNEREPIELSARDENGHYQWPRGNWFSILSIDCIRSSAHSCSARAHTHRTLSHVEAHRTSNTKAIKRKFSENSNRSIVPFLSRQKWKIIRRASEREPLNIERMRTAYTMQWKHTMHFEKRLSRAAGDRRVVAFCNFKDGETATWARSVSFTLLCNFAWNVLMLELLTTPTEIR